MAEVTFHLLMIPYAQSYLGYQSLKDRAQMPCPYEHCVHVKGLLCSEDEGKYNHHVLTWVWNTVQVTATSSPPTFSVSVALQNPFCCPQKEKSYLNWFKEWIFSPSFTDTPHPRRKTSILTSLKKFSPKVSSFCL